jgi:hypothetical protein
MQYHARMLRNLRYLYQTPSLGYARVSTAPRMRAARSSNSRRPGAEIARDMQRAEAGPRSLAKPYLDNNIVSHGFISGRDATKLIAPTRG